MSLRGVRQLADDKAIYNMLDRHSAGWRIAMTGSGQAKLELG